MPKICQKCGGRPPIVTPYLFHFVGGWSWGGGKKIVQERERVKGVKKPPAVPRRGGYHPPENLV